MKTLYIECSMGAAGDMLNAALYDLLEPKQQKIYLDTMNGANPNELKIHAERSQKCGIAGTHITVLARGEEERVEDVDLTHEHATCHADHAHHGHVHEHEHTHERNHEHRHGAHLADVTELIVSMGLPPQIEKNALAVYNSIAEAEAHAHGESVEQIHFHEVGTLDAIADVVGFCLLIDLIAPQRIACSPIHVGTGSVRCAHGIVPVPAPATAYLLRGIPTYGGNIQGELCTPTGAALIKHFAREFGAQPAMSVDNVGIGCGTKDFPAANIVRAFVGEGIDSGETSGEENTDQIVELICNIDDMTAEEISFATQTLIDAGAADVFTTAIGMKKNRPATMITCLCHPADKDRFVKLIFKHTTTLGVREHLCNRYILTRTEGEQETEFGPVGYKLSQGFGSNVRKFNHDELAQIAHANNLSLHEVKTRISNNADN